MRATGVAGIAAGLLVAASVACSDGGEDAAPTACTAGERRACRCAADANGTATCVDGAWSACACKPSGEGGAGGGGGMGGAAGSGGTAGAGGAGGTAGEGGAGGAAGAGGSGGTGGGVVVEPVCTQVEVEGGTLEACLRRIEGAVDEICLPSGCVDAGPRDEEGEIRRGAIKLIADIDPVNVAVSRIRSYRAELFHPVANDGRRIDCATILETEGWYDVGWNVMRIATGNVVRPGEALGTLLTQVPVNDPDRLYIGLLRVYGGSLDNGVPTGGVLGIGCKEGILVPEGDWENAPNRSYSVAVTAP